MAAASVLREDRPGDERLVAYFVPSTRLVKLHLLLAMLDFYPMTVMGWAWFALVAVPSLHQAETPPPPLLSWCLQVEILD